jgi:hypothetical protein
MEINFNKNMEIRENYCILIKNLNNKSKNSYDIF